MSRDARYDFFAQPVFSGQRGEPALPKTHHAAHNFVVSQSASRAQSWPASCGLQARCYSCPSLRAHVYDPTRSPALSPGAQALGTPRLAATLCGRVRRDGSRHPKPAFFVRGAASPPGSLLRMPAMHSRFDLLLRGAGDMQAGCVPRYPKNLPLLHSLARRLETSKTRLCLAFLIYPRLL